MQGLILNPLTVPLPGLPGSSHSWKMEPFRIHTATAKDVPLIMELIRGIAAYEHLSHEVTATEEELKHHLFGQNPAAEVLLGFEGTRSVGFALYFYNFSTFLGKPGLYLEDLFVYPEYRGRGYGKALFLEVATRARRKNCGRMEWAVLKWNQPAIAFYEKHKAREMDQWALYRLREEDLQTLIP